MPKSTSQITKVDDPTSSDEADENNDQPPRRKKTQLFRCKKNRDIQREKAGKILAVKWSDKRAVHLLTTVHKGAIVKTDKVHHRTKNGILKPDLVVDYTKNMRLVDKGDSQLDALGNLSSGM